MASFSIPSGLLACLQDALECLFEVLVSIFLAVSPDHTRGNRPSRPSDLTVCSRKGKEHQLGRCGRSPVSVTMQSQCIGSCRSERQGKPGKAEEQKGTHMGGMGNTGHASARTRRSGRGLNGPDVDSAHIFSRSTPVNLIIKICLFFSFG